jgi:hypothetical protein
MTHSTDVNEANDIENRIAQISTVAENVHVADLAETRTLELFFKFFHLFIGFVFFFGIYFFLDFVFSIFSDFFV